MWQHSPGPAVSEDENLDMDGSLYLLKHLRKVELDFYQSDTIIAYVWFFNIAIICMGKDMFKHMQNDFLKLCHGVTLTYERPIKNLGSLTITC